MKNSQMLQFVRYLGIYKNKLGRRFNIIFVLSIMSGIAESFGILMILPLLNSISNNGSSNSEEQNFIYNMISSFNLSTSEILIGIIVAFLLKGILLFIALSVNASMRAQLMKEYKENLYNSYISMTFSYYSSKDSGHFVNIINEQVNRALQALHFLTQVSVQLITAVIYILIAFFIAWRFGVMALVMGILLVYIFKRINIYVRSLSRMSANENGKLSKLIIQSLVGYEYLASTAQVDKTKDSVFNSISNLTSLQQRTWTASAITQAIREPLAVMMIMSIVLIQVVYNEEPLSPIIISIILFYRAMNSLLAMQTQWQYALEFIGSTELVDTEQKELNKNSEKFGNKKLVNFNKSIEIKNLSFSYDKDVSLIRDLNMTIDKNQEVAFIGHSGSGKSTIIKLITALVKPKSGSIVVDGTNITEVSVETWRKQIGYVSQSPVLFDDTIFNNITMSLGDSVINDKLKDNVKLACKKANISEFIESLPDGYNTNVGERGMRLSGGQRQRICIAREIYRKANILILDEATSALDSQSEQLIQKSLNALKGKITIIVIAHRLSTIKNADKIYVMDKGEVVESGSFNQLMEIEKSTLSQFVNTQKL